ncbi:YqaI family protein [Sediminibacillus massiliensis]|uniref:YqaI family protein n=1 Tax=Sediminibacillus massiliensis TaxID=1926277 RepID=UPI0009888287|nr:hypothetical protein [Sediminibacillus massiliensis]
MPELEHPTVTQINRTGYPKEALEQPEHCGIDALGDEILVGDKIFEIDGETVLEENLERYLVELMGAQIKEAI